MVIEYIIISLLATTTVAFIAMLSKELDNHQKTKTELIETIKRENYLLNAVNDSMQVLEPKRFLTHRMEIAPFTEVIYWDETETTDHISD